MSNDNWKEERERLVERVRKAEQIAAESQAEAAVYRDMLEDCYKAADQAFREKDLSLLHTITGKFDLNWMPSETDGKRWGEYFLHAYMKDAGWLRDTKEALEQIKKEAEKLSVEGDEMNTELKRKIIAAAKKGLISHI